MKYEPYRAPPETTIAKGIILGAALIALPVLLPMIGGFLLGALWWVLILNKALADAIGATSAMPVLFFEICLLMIWIGYMSNRKKIRAVGWRRYFFG